MAQFVGDINRKLVPRWRSSELTLMLGEMTPSNATRSETFALDDFDEKLAHFQRTPKVSSAAELLAAGFVHSRLEESREAAQFILQHSHSAPGLLNDMATRATTDFALSDPDDEKQPGEQIRSHRNLLSLEPRNPFKWVDLARNYLIVGRARKAMRAMDAALQLAPNNRFVLRSATRLYLHLRQPDRAHHVLSTTEALLYDPALVAPEIAISALLKKTSRLMRRGIELLDSQNYPETHLGELAAVIATEELYHGPARKARQLFRRSLVRPNENTVAQVRWAASRAVGVDFDPAYLQVARSFEARAWNQFQAGDWAQALLQSKAWLNDQGFSRRPAALGSFVSSVVMEDHVEAITILRRGLISNPRDPLLLNNLAYSLACIGQLEEAEQVLQQMSLTGDDESNASLPVIKAATTGLLEYRKGNPELGRSFYLKAYELASNDQLAALRARLALFSAMEEVRAGGDVTSPPVQAAIEASDRADDPVLRVLAKRMLQLRRS